MTEPADSAKAEARALPGGLNRATLAERVEQTLNRGGWGNPDVLLVRSDARSVVVKDYAPRSFLVRHTLGRWLIAREQRAYRRLAGLDAVPALLGRIDGLAFAVEYRPGRWLRRSMASSLPRDFVQRLERGVAEMHDRGVVHLDLRHRSNILADDRGNPVLLDFASALCLPRSGPAGGFARMLMPLFRWIDQRALGKWQERLGPDR